MKITQNILVIVAVLFGLLTIFAGTRVLLGSNPGYMRLTGSEINGVRLEINGVRLDIVKKSKEESRV